MSDQKASLNNKHRFIYLSYKKKDGHTSSLLEKKPFEVKNTLNIFFMLNFFI